VFIRVHSWFLRVFVACIRGRHEFFRSVLDLVDSFFCGFAVAQKEVELMCD
jgi:hypothetical protein